MKFNVFTCDCLLNHFIMTKNESQKEIADKYFSIEEGWKYNIKLVEMLHFYNNFFFFV